MWIVAKIKPKESSIFKEQLNKKFQNEVQFYEPKIHYQSNNSKKIKKLLGNYIFCFNEKFKNNNILSPAKYTKGLKYFLKDYKNSQKGILKFINFCQNYEDQDGFLLEGFFKNIAISKAKFLNGPLANLVFDILENNKNNLTIKIRQRKIFLKKSSNFFYLPV